jgi:hypothetical protein
LGWGCDGVVDDVVDDVTGADFFDSVDFFFFFAFFLIAVASSIGSVS